jgi:hypothetical protein
MVNLVALIRSSEPGIKTVLACMVMCTYVIMWLTCDEDCLSL